jgi:transcription antitermination protein NusB
MTRREIREKALQALFQLKTNPELTPREAIRQALLSDLEELNVEDDIEVADYPYLTTLVNGVLDNHEEIDKAIQPYLKNWTVGRLAKADALIMQIAAYEMLFGDTEQVPQRVALNEAIEIAKLYCDEQSSKFINGVLSNLIPKNENP